MCKNIQDKLVFATHCPHCQGLDYNIILIYTIYVEIIANFANARHWRNLSQQTFSPREKFATSGRVNVRDGRNFSCNTNQEPLVKFFTGEIFRVYGTLRCCSQLIVTCSQLTLWIKVG